MGDSATDRPWTVISETAWNALRQFAASRGQTLEDHGDPVPLLAPEDREALLLLSSRRGESVPETVGLILARYVDSGGGATPHEVPGEILTYWLRNQYGYYGR